MGPSTVDRSVAPMRTGGPRVKLATTVADRIVTDVIALDWPVGEVLGSEVELLERYAVSRAVFREAVRLVEHQQVARMRRGPGGGLVVTEPSIEAIMDAAVLYLFRLGARLDEVFEARLALEELVTTLAPSRLTDEDATRLRQLVRSESDREVTDHRTMHTLLAASTGNPALELFVEILKRVMMLYFAGSRDLGTSTLDEAARAHAGIVNAVTAGDSALAARRMRKHLEAEATFLRRRRTTRQVLDPTTAIKGAAGQKRAEEVAREIFRGIVAGRFTPGELIGSEVELIDRFGVSRAIVREAVRLLEHHDIAAMQRGPGGGLIVSVPSADAVTDIVALYLERHGIRASQVFEVRMGVELALIDLVVDNIDDEGTERLRIALDTEQNVGDDQFVAAVHDLHATLAAISGNRVLELLTVVLIRLCRLHEVGEMSGRTRRRVATEVDRTHGGIVQAVVARDREAARRRMRRHLEAVSSFFR
jgi:DNA-binding FadR family transcriptional regulator